LSDDRGAYKRTYKDRFVEFDTAACREIAGALSGRPLHVIDCAISDGRTAVDFFTRLAQSVPDVDFLGTDYDPYLRAVTDRRLTLVVSSSNDPVQLVWPPFVLNLKSPDGWVANPVNCVLRTALRRFRVPALLDRLGSSHDGRTISLFCEEAKSLAARDARFRLGRHDILAPFPQRYDVIRMMNVLNPTYFSTAEFEKIVANIRAGLVPGGLLIAGSNQEAGTSVAGGIYRFDGSGFTQVFNTGVTSTVQEIIMAAA
jgi:hypothetical protein